TPLRSFRLKFSFLILLGLTVVRGNPQSSLSAQSSGPQANSSVFRAGQFEDPSARSRVVPRLPVDPSAIPSEPEVGATGAGMTITATFDASLTAPEIAVINTAIAFYQNAFKDPITV